MSALIRGEDLPRERLIGRDDERRKLLSILMRNRANSVILVGSGGVGCSALVRGLQEMKTMTEAGYDIMSKRFFWLQTDELFESGDQKSIGEEFQRMISILRQTNESVLVIDEAKDFIDSLKAHGCHHFLNKLMATVTSGKTQVIMETRDDALDFVLKSHSDFRDSFTVMELHEPTGENLRDIVSFASGKLWSHHKIVIDPDAIHKAIELTMKFRDGALDRAQPERAVTLLDRALAAYRIKVHLQLPQEVKDEIVLSAGVLRSAEDSMIKIEDEIAAEQEKKKKKAEDKPKSALDRFDSETVISLRKKLDFIKAELVKRREAFDQVLFKANENFRLTVAEVKDTFTRISGMVPDDEDEGTKILKFEDRANTRIFGQEEAIKRVATHVKVARFGRKIGNGPKGSFMFLGPSGVGKTELSKAMAQNLLGDERLLARFDMGEYMEKHSVAKLIGAPPGYELAEVGGTLTNTMRRNPYRVVLFDEIEKAHQDLANVFLAVLSDGRLTDNVGRTVSFEESYVVFTGNVGSEYFLDDNLTLEQANEAAMEELAAKYRPEFLNRFNGRENIIPFKKLSHETMEKIVSKHLVEIEKAYGDQLTFSVVPDSVHRFVADHYDAKIGARGLPGYIQRYLDGAIVDWRAMNEGKMGKATILYEDGNLRVDISA